MKSYIIPAILSIIILTGCSSTKSTADYDDVYYSTRTEKQAAKQKQKELKSAQPDYYTENDNVTTDYYVEDYETGENASYEEEPTYVESETMQGPEGAAYITNNYYGSSGYDGYNDYSYSSAINRFYNPYAGFGYYSPYYAGFYYDPYFYMPSFYFSMSWGWGGYGCGYPYYPYNNYWYGYNQGYYNGYWDGYYDNNYYSDGSTYYGPRTSGYSSDGTSSSQRGGANNISRAGNIENVYAGPIASRIGNVSNEASRTSTAVNTTNEKRPSANNTSGVSSENAIGGKRASTVNTGVLGTAAATPQDAKAKKTTPTSQKPRYTYKKPAAKNKTNTGYSPGEKLSSSSNPAKRNVSQKYQKPTGTQGANSLNNKRTNTASGNTQVYSKRKSTSDKSYTQPTKYNSSRSTTNSSQNARKTYTQPSRTNTKSYSTPSRSTNSGNSRSYSSPSRSSGSKSYSSPSRSSSSGGSRSSSSGGGSRSSSSGGRR